MRNPQGNGVQIKQSQGGLSLENMGQIVLCVEKETERGRWPDPPWQELQHDLQIYMFTLPDLLCYVQTAAKGTIQKQYFNLDFFSSHFPPGIFSYFGKTTYTALVPCLQLLLGGVGYYVWNIGKGDRNQILNPGTTDFSGTGISPIVSRHSLTIDFLGHTEQVIQGQIFKVKHMQTFVDANKFVNMCQQIKYLCGDRWAVRHLKALCAHKSGP